MVSNDQMFGMFIALRNLEKCLENTLILVKISLKILLDSLVEQTINMREPIFEPLRDQFCDLTTLTGLVGCLPYCRKVGWSNWWRIQSRKKKNSIRNQHQKIKYLEIYFQIYVF